MSGGSTRMVGKGAPPWLIWGDFKQFNMQARSAATLREQGQLALVEYGRPETWRFFFAVKLFSGTSGSPAQLRVDFDLTFGVGRAVVQVPSFETFLFGGVGPGPVLGATKYSSSVNGPVRDDTSVAPFPPNVIETIEAQSINVQIRAQFQPTVAGDNLQFEAHAYFAPNVHVRPEWSIGHFPGGEDSGR